MSPCSTDNPKKIGGYGKWDVEDAVRTMRRSAEIEADKKFLKVVVAEMKRESDRLEDKANLLTKVSAKLKSTFGKGKK
ncbi:MAG: hypothetical protein ACW99U_20665 [Candidatus Thorarchaeota archaeon]|jgi:hypothetical protein